jgi:hypothetical protein
VQLNRKAGVVVVVRIKHRQINHGDVYQTEYLAIAIKQAVYDHTSQHSYCHWSISVIHADALIINNSLRNRPLPNTIIYGIVYITNDDTLNQLTDDKPTI